MTPSDPVPWTQRLVPPDLIGGADVARQGTLAVWLSMGLGPAMGVAAAISFLARGLTPQGLTLAMGTAVTVASLGLMWWTRRPWTTVWGTIVGCALPVTFVVWTGYGPVAPAAMGLPLLAVLGFVADGRRGGLFCVAVVLTEAFGLFVAHRAGWAFRTPDDAYPTLFLLTLCLVTVMISVFLGSYDHVWRRASAQADDAYRALAVAHEEAQVARDEAIRANQAKSTFLANMSHELRTPLNAIIGYAEMLEEELDDDELSADLVRIHRAGRHLLELVNDVLDMSRIEADRLELHPSSVDVPRLIDELRERLGPAARQHRDQVRVQLPDPCPRLWADRLRLGQVLTNLVSNAIKFTEDGTVTLRVTREREHMVFDVIDTGRGMDEALQQACFQPFEQAPGASGGRDRGGTGLGLAISHRLAEAMGGTLSVRSAVGQGSCFTLRLPHPP